MALKKLVDVGEAFPVRRNPRLGVAPPPADVLDNVGVADPLPVPVTAKEEGRIPPRENARAAPDHSQGGDGRGVHTGKGIDARRQRKTGRDYQFGARTTAGFADEVKRIALSKGIAIGELLEDMLAAYGVQMR